RQLVGAGRVQDVDRGVDARLDLVARQTGLDRLAEMDRYRAGALPPAVVKRTAVYRYRHHRQSEELVQAGKARTQWRLGPARHAGSFGEDHQGTSGPAERARLRQHRPQRPGTLVAANHDRAVAPGRSPPAG